MELVKDLESIANKAKSNQYVNSRILVTGATGLIGSLIVKGFIVANRKYKLNNKIFALARNIEKANSIFKEYLEDDNFNIVINEITQEINIDEDIDYIFHTACVTTSKDMVTFPTELIKTSINGTINVLEFAKSHNTKSCIYLSSMEAYGQVIGEKKSLKEEDLGYLDLTYVRNCYPESKRMNENLCKCYFDEYGLNVVIARLSQTFGAGVDINDNRIFAYIAKSAINKQDITLKTTGKSAHDYCYTTDAIDALLILGKRGMGGECYNISNNKTYSNIFNMAEIVLKKYYPEGKVIIQESNTNMFSKESEISLNTDKMHELGWVPKFNLIQMYEKLINYYKENGLN